ncbi:hypothetical protein, partial [Legionella sp.]|uniref:hypothetical protein n=1 Tax=Legionella sp. TaxID=459 RepID=UPI003C89BF8B
ANSISTPFITWRFKKERNLSSTIFLFNIFSSNYNFLIHNWRYINNMTVLNGYMAVVGCAAVAAAFIVLLNAATFGIPGLIAITGLGITSVLARVGYFAISKYINEEKNPEPDNSADCFGLSL